MEVIMGKEVSQSSEKATVKADAPTSDMDTEKEIAQVDEVPTLAIISAPVSMLQDVPSSDSAKPDDKVAF